MAVKHQAKKITQGEYLYRGQTIYRRNHISPGYMGSWYVNGKDADSLKAAKKIVDNKLGKS